MDNLKSEFFKQLTWSDIKGWAGDTITSRGRSYQSDGSVQNLAFTRDRGLLAWVQGTERYATLLDILQIDRKSQTVLVMWGIPKGGYLQRFLLPHTGRTQNGGKKAF